jgi:hypothetical protein
LRVRGVAHDAASGLQPSFLAVDWRIITSAAAPSLMLELEAAVMVPSFLNAGLSVGILSSLTLPGPSSTLHGDSPLRVLTVTGVISALKGARIDGGLGALDAGVMAKASCSARVNWYLAAQSSPKVPMERPAS